MMTHASTLEEFASILLLNPKTVQALEADANRKKASFEAFLASSRAFAEGVRNARRSESIGRVEAPYYAGLVFEDDVGPPKEWCADIEYKLPMH